MLYSATLPTSTAPLEPLLQLPSSLSVKMSFNTPWFNQQDPSFFNALNKSKVVHIILAGESEDFADEVIKQWQSEGFNVTYVPLGKGGKDFVARIKSAGENTGVGEQYAVVGNTRQFPRS